MTSTQENKKDIRCEETHKLLAKMDEEAIYIWCKECRVEHKILLKSITKELVRIK